MGSNAIGTTGILGVKETTLGKFHGLAGTNKACISTTCISKTSNLTPQVKFGDMEVTMLVLLIFLENVTGLILDLLSTSNTMEPTLSSIRDVSKTETYGSDTGQFQETARANSKLDARPKNGRVLSGKMDKRTLCNLICKSTTTEFMEMVMIPLEVLSSEVTPMEKMSVSTNNTMANIPYYIMVS